MEFGAKIEVINSELLLINLIKSILSYFFVSGAKSTVRVRRTLWSLVETVKAIDFRSHQTKARIELVPGETPVQRLGVLPEGGGV